jgi:hypothetical protein
LLGLGQLGEAATELAERLAGAVGPERGERVRDLPASNIGHPMQIATTSGIAAPGAGARIAPTHTAALIRAVNRAASRTRRGCARLIGRHIVNA